MGRWKEEGQGLIALVRVGPKRHPFQKLLVTPVCCQGENHCSTFSWVADRVTLPMARKAGSKREGGSVTRWRW